MSKSEQTQHRLVELKYKHPAIFPEIDGAFHMPGTTRELLQVIPSLETKQNDVFIASWPKSGSTWMMETVYQIHHNAQINDTQIDKKVPFLELLSRGASPDDVRAAFDGLPSPRLIKTHLHYEFVPNPSRNEPKIVLVVRHPKDCAVSYFHHYTGFNVLECDCDWDEFFDHFMNGKLVGGNWFKYVREWWKHRNDPNILIIKYEDLKRDQIGSIKRIAAFVNKELSPATVQRIADQTSFKAMQGRASFDHKWFGTKPGSFRFIRKGETGDWKNYFSVEQSARFDELFDKEMKGSGLTLDYFK